MRERNRFSKLWILCIPLLILSLLSQGCKEEFDPAENNEAIKLDFKRTDLLMADAARSLKGSENPEEYLDTYYRFLEEDKLFFSELLGITVVPGQQSKKELDTLIANNFGPLLADENISFLADTVKLILGDSIKIENEIKPILTRLNYYFKEDSLSFPAFRTHINGFIPDGGVNDIDQIRIGPTYISFGLHFFLGKDFPYYPYQIPSYIRKRYSLKYLPSLLAQEISEGMVSDIEANNQPNLLQKMIRAGIKQHLIHKLLPSAPDSLLFLYNGKQVEWAYYYEAEIYKELMPYLYDINFVVHRDFLGEKPYTSHMGEESAPRIAEFIGWRIVESYMDKYPGVSTRALCLDSDYDKIFKSSGYKPK